MIPRIFYILSCDVVYILYSLGALGFIQVLYILGIAWIYFGIFGYIFGYILGDFTYISHIFPRPTSPGPGK